MERYLKVNSLKNHNSTCESCGKSFLQAGDLNRYIYTVHEGHKDHKCETCSKSFSTAQYMKKHIHTVHEGHKDYNCESFSHTYSLKKHIDTQRSQMCVLWKIIFSSRNFEKSNQHIS